MTRSRLTRTCAVAAAAALAVAAPAGAGTVAVIVTPPFPLERYADTGAVGLLVPGAGSHVTRDGALAALVRGRVRTSLLGGKPSGAPLIRLAQRPAAVTIYVALPPAGQSANVRRYPVAIVGGGYHGLLTSSATRIPGLVSIADVAPTAVALAHERRPRIRARAAAEAPAELRRLDGRLDGAHEARTTVRLLVVALIGLTLAAAVAFRSATAARASLLAAPAALGALLALSAAGADGTGAALAGIALAGVATVGVGRLGDRALAAAVAAFLVAWLVVLAAWPEVNALALVGPHPEGGGRYYGVTNETETLVLAPTLAAAAVAGPRGLPAIAALAFLAVGWSRTGADGGGVLVLAAAFAVLLLRLGAGRLAARRTAVAVTAAAAVALGLIAVDAATGGASHVTDAVSSGPGSLASDTLHRWRVSWAGATRSGGAVGQALAGALGLLAFVLVRPRPATVDAMLVAVAVSLVVNDTPQDVLAFGAFGCACLWAWERLRVRPQRR